MSPHCDAPSGSYSPPNAIHFSNPNHNSSLRPNAHSIYDTPTYSSSFSSSISNTSANTSDTESTRHPHRELLPGVYVPTLCFFQPTSEDLDLATISSHVVRLAQAGVTGLATQGSNGEAVHLSHAERCLVTSTTRKALDDAGFTNLPVIVGCGAQSTREAIQLCKEAYTAGGDYALVLPPSYYQGLFKPGMQSVVEYFTAVADASPIPLIIYNYPGAVSGMDLSSDLIIQLSQHPNIVGVKLTCGNTGKLNRVAAATRSSAKSISGAPSFLVLGGSADFALQTLIGGGHGILGGLANLSPKACLKMVSLYNNGDFAEAQKVQEVVSRGDWAAIQGGIVGTKAGMNAWCGYGGNARAPLPSVVGKELEKWKELFRELMVLEKSL